MMSTLSPPPHYPGRIPTDASNPFAHDTMTRRVPETLHMIQTRNPDYPPSIQGALQALSDDIQGGGGIPPVPAHAPDYALWTPEIQIRERERHTWLSTDWFFAETYFYRQVMACVRWWETNRDPFAPNKAEEYGSAALWQLLEAALSSAGPPEQRLAEAISRALWGNRIDLSYAEAMAHGTAMNADDLLVNDTEAVVAQLVAGDGPVHIITDNAGTELTMDLVLADVLLSSVAQRVTLHLKLHPTFVSDATPADVWGFMALLAGRGGDYAAFGGRLQAAFEAGRLQLLPHFFWNSSHSLWELPAPLLSVFEGARLTIVKGDANYRRMVGDALWPAHTPFVNVLGYFPTPLLALRTLKSDPVLGLAPGLAETLDPIDARWRYNGKRGLIQYKR